MNYEINLRSLLLLVAMVQAIIVAILLARRRLRGDLFLTGLILSLAMSLISHLIGFMGMYDYARENGFDLSFFPFTNFLLYGPFLLLYVLALTDLNFVWNRRYWWWFLPALVSFTVHIGVWFLTPEIEKRAIEERPVIYVYNILETLCFYIVTGWFLFKAITRMRGYAQVIEQEYSNTGAITQRWLQAFLYAFAGYYLIDLAFEVTGLFVYLNYTGFYWINLIRACLLYYISATGLAYGRKTMVEYTLLQHRAQTLKSLVTTGSESSEAAKQPLSDEEMARYRQVLLQYFQDNQPWLDPELTLSQLAGKMNMNTTQLSYLINTGTGKNFNDFVNEYRAEAVKSKLQDPAFQHLSLLGIAFECGFNSKATFNRAFKKATGEAPSAFKE